MRNLLISFIIIFGVVSCDSTLDDFAENPNSPETVTPALLLSAAEVGSFATYCGQLARLSAILTQHTAGTVEGSQYVRFSNYDILEQDFNNEWTGIYTDILVNANEIIVAFGPENPYYAGIAKILTAFNLGVATDFWGDIPYADALGGLEGNKTPSFDTQEDVVQTIYNLCDDALVDFGKAATENTFVPGSDDLIFEGDLEKWTKAAYMIKARYANRLSLVTTGSETTVLGFLASANLTGNEDDMNAIFPDTGGNSRNQWIDFQNQRGNYMKMGEYFIDMMINTNDPRLPFFATTDADDGYSGNTVGDVETTSTSDVGPAIASNTASIGMLTYVEMKFIEAEARLRDADPTGAQTAFEEAVSASLEKVVGEVDQDFVDDVTATLTLEAIMQQKYVALFSSIEPFNDYRRTGFPVLTPNPNAQTTQIPLRLPTSSDERIYNPNATVVSDIYTPVWWDN